MKFFITLLLFAGLLTACGPSPTELPQRAPIDIRVEGENEGADKENRHERWLESLHRAAPGTDWRKLESHNAMARHRKRQGRFTEKSSESFADGLLTGEWFERGSKYTAGSVFDVVQDPTDANRLFLMSAGGSIWEMDYKSEAYSLVNHDIYFDREFLGLVPVDAGRHLLAFSDSRPMYSPDDGKSWEFATVRENGNVIDEAAMDNFFSPQVIGDEIFTTIQILRGNYEIFHSVDGGISYDQLPGPPQATVDGNQTITHLYNPPGTERLFAAMKRTGDNAGVNLYELDRSTASFRLISSVSVEKTGSYRSRIAAARQPGTDSLRIFLQAYDQLFRSDNDGLDWREMPRLDKVPWRYQSIYVRPSDPDFVAWGAVELWVSRDGGETFAYPNRWNDYYADPVRYLHADIMRLTEITDPDGESQMLVSNHGGLNQLEPADSMWYSVAQEGLNVAQYYDVRTNPGDENIIYAGSQDQGFQILDEDDSSRRNVLGGYQWFSGDYGHLDFAEEGNVFFTAYPGGFVYGFYDVLDEENGLGWSSFEIESPDEFIWITPMMSPPRLDGQVKLYIAGGSSDTARAGSFLVEVDLNRDEDDVHYGAMTGRDLPLDFKDAAAGQISAMTYSPMNPDRFYVATDQGRFFASDDRGENWSETLNFLPSGWYLYGQAIHASKTEAETVWLGGSGYSNPPVWRSEDGGENFFPASDGLPPTVVHGLTANATESLIFAATEAGPFVYVVSEERWFDLAGQYAPTMRYYSVEFLEDRNIARFGTYGRGAWDFQVEQLVSIDEPLARGAAPRIYPNPASGSTTVEGKAGGYRLYDIGGREMRRVVATGEQTQLSLEGLAPGLYFVQPLDSDGRVTGLGQRVVVR